MNITQDQKPGVGLCIVLLRDRKVLLGKRKSEIGKGHWCPPGGKLEWMEDLQDCCARELLEETGLIATPFVATDDWGHKDGDCFSLYHTAASRTTQHYVTLFFTAPFCTGEPKDMEPDKCEGWHWFDVNDLPSPLFNKTGEAIDVLKQMRGLNRVVKIEPPTDADIAEAKRLIAQIANDPQLVISRGHSFDLDWHKSTPDDRAFLSGFSTVDKHARAAKFATDLCKDIGEPFLAPEVERRTIKLLESL